MTLSFATTRTDLDLLAKIADRADAEIREVVYPRVDLEMDLCACHANGCPLDFEKLLSFPSFDFLHDVLGIRRHLNRTTGKLERCFLPRCAR